MGSVAVRPRPGRAAAAFGLVLAALAASGCYASRRSAAGGCVPPSGARPVDPASIAVPPGYRVEVVATGLTYPSGVAFDGAGVPHVVESGYAYGETWAEARLLRVERGGSTTVVARGGERAGPWTGVAWHGGAFFVAEGGTLHGGRILKVAPDGTTTALVSGLPSYGDHHTNGPVVDAEGWVYFGQGVATNSGVVGEDSAKFGWLERFPRFHDVPGADVVLAGVNFTTPDVRTPAEGDVAVTGAFVPFGTATAPGQVVRGQVAASGSVLRVKADGGPLELVAWGFRNPFGFAFGPDGALYVTDNGYDERGSRPVFGSGDFLWRVQRGLWHGWPDYAGGEPVFDADYTGPCGPCPPKVLAKDPNPPPRPVAVLDVHSSSNGLDVSRGPFGYPGCAFVAQLGDMAPGVGKVMSAVGFKVVRVDLSNGVVHDFAVNPGHRNGPASALGTGGLERPVAARFDPSGTALYVVDFGVMSTASGKPQAVPRTGVLWRIVRAGC